MQPINDNLLFALQMEQSIYDDCYWEELAQAAAHAEPKQEREDADQSSAGAFLPTAPRDQGLRPEMINHPNRSNLSYPTPAPVFDSEATQHPATYTIIGHAMTAKEAMALYDTHFVGTGAKAVRALKASPELRDQGVVDGWVPELADE